MMFFFFNFIIVVNIFIYFFFMLRRDKERHEKSCVGAILWISNEISNNTYYIYIKIMIINVENFNAKNYYCINNKLITNGISERGIFISTWLSRQILYKKKKILIILFSLALINNNVLQIKNSITDRVIHPST